MRHAILLLLVATAAHGQTFSGDTGPITITAIRQTFMRDSGGVQGPDLVAKNLANGELALTFRSAVTHYWSEGPSTDVSVWREVYGCRDGKVVLLRKVDAKCVPAATTTTPERVEWPAVPR